MTIGELIDRVTLIVGCDTADAFQVAQALHDGRANYTDNEIRYAAARVGVGAGVQAPEPEPRPFGPELSMDPAVVMREMYLACPRCIPADADGKTHIPVIGRAPQDEAHQIPPEILEQLPEHIRVLLMSVDLYNGEAEIVLYDSANGVDRKLPRFDLTRFDDATALNDALDVLLKRLPKYLAADSN